MIGLTAIECFVAITIIYIILYWITPRKNVWLPMIVFVVLVTILAYYINPNETDDLSRYFNQLDLLREYGYDYLKRCINHGINSWDTYRVCGYYFYFISRLPNNHWMAAVTIFIVYGLNFFIIYRYANRFSINKWYLFIGTMFFISTYWYYDTVSGIRNGLAFSVIIACAYMHLVERKNIPLCLVGYVLACLTHSSSIILVVMVAIAELTLNTSGKFIKFLLIFGVSGGSAGIQYLSTKTSNSFVQSIAGKSEIYSANDTLYTDTNFLVNIVTAVFVALIMIYVSKYIIDGFYANDLKRIYKYFSLIQYFLVGSLLSTLVFMRIARWIIPLVGAFIYMAGMQIQYNQIQQDGENYYKYYAPPEQAFRYKIKPLVNISYIAYILIHYWYLCAGSSVHWMHF